MTKTQTVTSNVEQLRGRKPRNGNNPWKTHQGIKPGLIILAQWINLQGMAPEAVRLNKAYAIRAGWRDHALDFLVHREAQLVELGFLEPYTDLEFRDFAQAAAHALGVGNWEKLKEGKLLVQLLRNVGYKLVPIALALLTFMGCAQSQLPTPASGECPLPELVEGSEPCGSAVDVFTPPAAQGVLPRALGCFKVEDGQPVIYFVAGGNQEHTDNLLDYEHGQWAKWCAR